MNINKFRYFFPKVGIRLALEKNRLWKYIDVDKWSVHGYVPSDNAGTLKWRIENMLGSFTRDLISDLSEDIRLTIIRSADQALRHEFDLLGSGVSLVDPIDWHVDFKSGKRWEKKYYNEIEFIPGADIKVPWELSRCQHLLWLGEAYLLTGDVKYANEVVDEIRCWIKDNPLMYTVNWKCSMDVAFRAVNWIFALNMIKSYSGYDDSFAHIVERSLWQHGFFIRNNFEKTIPYSNNHYTSDLVGLLYLGQLFCNSKRGNRWKKLAKKELEKEILTQVLPSGVHYEKSVSYHRMMTEMLSYPVFMLERNGDSFPANVLSRIALMFDFISNYTKPNGLAPLIADNDDGRFLPLLKRNFAEHGYMCDAASLENRIISLGTDFKFPSNVHVSKLYEDANMAVIHTDRTYLFLNGGGYSGKPGKGIECVNTHTHNDALSFELSIDGRDFIVDSGAYLYTSNSEKRNAFRSTLKHNTVFVDGEEQNDFVGFFRMKKNAIYNPLQNKNGVYEGSYVTLRGKMNHRRSFRFFQDRLEVRDIINKDGTNHNVRIIFHFAPGLTPQIDDKIVKANGVSMIFNKTPKHLIVMDDTVSPSFGVLTENKTVVVSFDFDNELEVITKIVY